MGSGSVQPSGAISTIQRVTIGDGWPGFYQSSQFQCKVTIYPKYKAEIAMKPKYRADNIGGIR